MSAPTQLLTGFAKTARTTKPDPKRRLTIRDPDARGLFVRITPAGSRTWLAMARDPQGKQVWATIGDAMAMEVSEAREMGRLAVSRIKRGETPIPKVATEKAPESFWAVAERFLERHVRKQELRSAGEIERQFKVYIYPEIRDEPFISIRRRRIVELLDKIEDYNGPIMADRVLATLRKLFNWYEVRNEDYASPIVRGMRISSAKARARKRILSDEEIRLLWADWSKAGAFGAFLQTCLLTAQRRAKVLAMKWSDLTDDGIWVIPIEPREKPHAGTLNLSMLTLDIIRTRPKVKGNPYVFAGRGTTHINNIGHDKAYLDKRVPTKEPWQIHDLRRTAKSLMARAGVRPDISERTLGHTIAGVEGVYDQHDYKVEKADAVGKLAALIRLILMPPSSNVANLKKVDV